MQLHLGHGANDDLGTAHWTPVLGAARDVPFADKRDGATTLKKIIAFGILEDFPAIKVKDGTAQVTSAQILAIRDVAAEKLRQQLQRTRNDRSQFTKDKLSSSSDPHSAKLFQHIRGQRVPTPTTMYDEAAGCYTSSIARIILLVEEAWEPVLNRNKVALPSWASFDKDYGK